MFKNESFFYPYTDKNKLSYYIGNIIYRASE